MASFVCHLYFHPVTCSIFKEHIIKLQSLCDVEVKQDPPLLCISLMLLQPVPPPCCCSTGPTDPPGNCCCCAAAAAAAAAGPLIAIPHVCQHRNTSRTSSTLRNAYRATRHTPVLLLRVSIYDGSLQYFK